MLLVDARPKEITFLIEMSLSEVEMLVDAMGVCEIHLDNDSTAEQRKSADFFKEHFWQILNDMIDKYKVE